MVVPGEDEWETELIIVAVDLTSWLSNTDVNEYVHVYTNPWQYL